MQTSKEAETEKFISKSTIIRKDSQGLPDKPNWGVTFTIKNAWEAKCHAAMYSSRWQKETWKNWFSFLRSINVGYTRERGYYDIG